MARLWLPPLAVWAARDVLRRPGEALLLGTSLAALAMVVATPLLLTGAVTSTSAELLAEGPSLVVRRLGPQGWAPVPVDEAVRVARRVRGVTGVAARTWGLVTGPDGPLTVVGADPERTDIELPAGRGEAVVGPGVGTEPGDTITLRAVEAIAFRVRQRLGDELGIVANDLVLVHIDDARRLLGLPASQASDLAVEVFHEQEQAAVLPDLARAFPWPVRITTRSEALGALAAGQARGGGLVLLAVVPALLALCLLAAVAVRERSGGLSEVGLLRAWGWTTSNLARFFLWRALAVGLPAVAAGLGVAYALALWPGLDWPGTWLLGWSSKPPALTLDVGGAGLVLAEVGTLVLVPWLVANLWPALRNAVRDPAAELDRGGCGG